MTSNHKLPTAFNRNLAGFQSNRMTQRDGFLPARHVRERYRVSDMTLWRWLRDDEMGFPQPIYLGRHRYWRISDIEAWEAAQELRGAA